MAKISSFQIQWRGEEAFNAILHSLTHEYWGTLCLLVSNSITDESKAPCDLSFPHAFHDLPSGHA
ncbi:hypothetical protein HI914_06242 [Erysiphe necator]|nr:hypothetical protein HI914_06242 [Erysiphe necator]